MKKPMQQKLDSKEPDMVSVEDSQPSSTLADSSPRISFDFLDEADFISISPEKDMKYSGIMKSGGEFEFLSSKSLNCSSTTMLTADELIFEGKLLPFKKINLKSSKANETEEEEDEDEQKKARRAVNEIMGNKMEEPRIWYIDDDPSPRPPKCTVLWKELLRLRKNRSSPGSSSSSSLSPSSSSSSSSSSSMGDHVAAMDEGEKPGMSSKEKHLKRLKKGLERTRSSTSIRIRPMVNVPICTQLKNTSLPPLFPPRKSRVTER